jgi:FkbM family methyltransferase
LRIIDHLWRTTLIGDDTHRLATLKYGGFQVPCDLSEMLQRQFYFFGTYFLEEDVLACWQSMAKDAKVILDVGANAGIYSLAALAIQREASVHAFEPTPEIAERLRATAESNGLCTLRVHQVAVLSGEGEAILRRYRGESGNNEGMNFISQDLGKFDGERIQTVCLDQFCRDHSIAYIDLLKLDVQGHEHSVLRGARNLLEAGRIGTIFMELNWGKNSAAVCSASESVQLLTQAGYVFSKPGVCLNWARPGGWLRSLSDVVAHRMQD